MNAYLLEAHARDRRTILIIDEAQNLSIEVLEQLRLLTNLETHQRKLLQIILLGQPELLDMLTKPAPSASQRITARFHLGSFKQKGVASYIRHRLIAGAKDTSPGAQSIGSSAKRRNSKSHQLDLRPFDARCIFRG